MSAAARLEHALTCLTPAQDCYVEQKQAKSVCV